jgi:Spy/CpxP family protein refolding chaperone
MKKKVLFPVIFALVALAAVLMVQHSTKAQDSPPGPPAGGMPMGESMMVRSLPLESSWAYISFELDVTNEALPKVRKLYQESWDSRKELIKKIDDARGDREAMQSLRGEAEKIKSDLEKKLEDVLTPEQAKKLKDWEEEMRQQLQERASRRPRR